MIRSLSVGLIVALTVGLPTQAGAEPASEASASPTADKTGTARESVDYLIARYGVTEAEAMRRLSLQLRSATMIEQVRAATGGALLDAWLDHTAGGKLTFLTNEPDKTRQALGGGFDPANMQIRHSRHTAAQLQAAALRVSGRLQGLTGAQVDTDLRNGKVVVRYRGDDAVSRAADVRRMVGGPAESGVAVEVDSQVSAVGEQRACGNLACDTPMRSGVRLNVRRNNGSWGTCTSGFNVRGSNGLYYMLTAGHCVYSTTNAPGTVRQFVFSNGLPVAWEHTNGVASDPTSVADANYYEAPDNGGKQYRDWSLLPYQTSGANWAGYWLANRTKRNLVQTTCVAPSPQPCANGTYSITGLATHAQITAGSVVCATGTGTATAYPAIAPYTPGTRCGEIITKYMNDYYDENLPGGTDGQGYGLKVNICSRSGDSGGPLFSQLDGKAYGILSGGVPRAGLPCDTTAAENGVYSPVSEILSSASTRTGITMSLITTALG